MKPFEGIRILDLTHVLAGPFSTYQLAVLGADVIKIESPQVPDMTREEGVVAEDSAQAYGTYFQSQSAAKRSIQLDLKTASGRSVMWRLIESADVLVHNYAAGAMDKLGFSYEVVAKKKPSLIYCSISGYGATGPKAMHPAYDNVIQAFSGLMCANGEYKSAPVKVGPPLVDYGTGAQAALAISAALFQRQASKQGQFIDVSMLDSALMLMTAPINEALISKSSYETHGNAHASYAGYAAYDTKQDTLMIGAWTSKQLAKLFTVLNEHERAQEVLARPRAKRHEYREKDAKLIASKLKDKTADEWEAVLNDAHVPAARVRTMVEAVASEQVNSRQVLQKVSSVSDAQSPRFPVAGFAYAHDGPSIDRLPPKLGEHTREVLLEVGLADSEIDQLYRDGVCAFTFSK